MKEFLMFWISINERLNQLITQLGNILIWQVLREQVPDQACLSADSSRSEKSYS